MNRIKNLKNRIDQLSIKWKVFTWLVGFCAILIVLLWLFQVVFLNGFYRSIKVGAIRSGAERIAKSINSGSLDTVILNVAEKNEICISLIDVTGKSVYSADIQDECVIHKMPSSELYKLYVQTQGEGAPLLQYYQKRLVQDRRGETIMLTEVDPDKNGDGDTIIYSRILKDKNGTEYLLLLNSLIAPVESTVQTLRIQLFWITGVMILLAALLALIISRHVSKPIVAISQSAKELAKGSYETAFQGRGYKEICELADTLSYAATELSKVDKLRRELIANISHDLRTPLTLIEGYGEVMRDIPGENNPENVQVIIDEARRLTTLVNDVLDISKYQSGVGALEISEFSLTQTVASIIQRVGKFCETQGYQIELLSDCDAFVNADEVKISQVIYNLLGNAITYTGEDKRVQIRQIIADNKVRIEVADSGAGISEEQLPHIWERYYKANKEHRRSVVGTGLGLSIVKAIVDMHSGASCGVYSTVGEGSVFWFELEMEKCV